MKKGEGAFTRNQVAYHQGGSYLSEREKRNLANTLTEDAEARAHAALVARTEAHAGDLIRYHGHGVLWASYYVGRDRQWGGR